MKFFLHGRCPVHFAGQVHNAAIKEVFDLLVLVFPLSRAEHRRHGRVKARGLFEPADRRVSFRALRPYQPVDAASIVLPGKASREARRTAIARL